MKDEIWKTVEDFPKYKISNYGRLKSYHSGKEKILKPYVNPYGYVIYDLFNENPELLEK